MQYIKPELEIIFLNKSTDIITESNTELIPGKVGGEEGGSWTEFL